MAKRGNATVITKTSGIDKASIVAVSKQFMIGVKDSFAS